MSGGTATTPQHSSKRVDCLIVGAGLAGLTAARHLASTGTQVLLVDKAKSPGGRLATRHIGAARLDHGAQFFTVRSDEFAAEVETWMEDGVVDIWSHGFATNDGHPRYRAVDGMASVAHYLSDRLQSDLLRPPARVSRVEASAVIADTDHWSVTYAAGHREPDEAASVVLTPPIPLSTQLLRSGAVAAPGLDELATAAYHQVIAIMVTLDRSPGLPAPGALQQPEDPIFTFVADNQTKGVSDRPAVTFHCAHELSESLWDLDDGNVLAHVHEEMRRHLGGAAVDAVQIKRWRHAGPVEPRSEPCFVAATSPGPLVLAGDGFAGAKVEGAFLSGLAAADAVLDTGANRRGANRPLYGNAVIE